MPPKKKKLPPLKVKPKKQKSKGKKPKTKRLVRFPEPDQDPNEDDVKDRRAGDKTSKTTYEAGPRQRVDYNHIEDSYIARFVQRKASEGLEHHINPAMMRETQDPDILFVIGGCGGLGTPRKRSAIWSHINRHKTNGVGLLYMDVNIPDDVRDVSDENYAKLQNENKRLVKEIDMKKNELDNKTSLIKKLNGKLLDANITFAKHLVDQYGSNKQKEHNLQPVVDVEIIAIDKKEIDRAREEMNKGNVEEDNDENNESIPDNEDVLSEPSISQDILIGKRAQNFKRKNKKSSVSSSVEKSQDSESFKIAENSSELQVEDDLHDQLLDREKITDEQLEGNDSEFKMCQNSAENSDYDDTIQDMNNENEHSLPEDESIDEILSEPSISQNIPIKEGMQKASRKNKIFSSVSSEDNKKASCVQPSNVTENINEPQVEEDFDNHLLDGNQMTNDEDMERNDLSFSSCGSVGAGIDVDNILQDMSAENETAEALEPGGPSVSIRRQKPSVSSKSDSSHSQIQEPCSQVQEVLDMIMDNDNEEKKSVKFPKQRKFNLSKLLPRYKQQQKSPVKRNRKKKSRFGQEKKSIDASSFEHFSETGNDTDSDRLFIKTSQSSLEIEDINNNSLDDNIGSPCVETVESRSPPQIPLLVDDVLQIGLVDEDLFDEDNDGLDALPDVMESASVKSASMESSVVEEMRPPAQSRSRIVVRSPRESVASASRVPVQKQRKVSRVPNMPMPKGRKSRYVRKNQSKRKDLHIKNRFSKTLREKKEEEDKNRKKFENVVTFQTKAFNPNTFKKIPKKTDASDIPGPSAELNMDPSTSKESNEVSKQRTGKRYNVLDSSSSFEET